MTYVVTTTAGTTTTRRTFPTMAQAMRARKYALKGATMVVVARTL